MSSGVTRFEQEIRWELAGFRLSFCGRPASTSDHESNLFPLLPLVLSQKRTKGTMTIGRPLAVVFKGCGDVYRVYSYNNGNRPMHQCGGTYRWNFVSAALKCILLLYSTDK